MIRPRLCGWMVAKWVRLSAYGPPAPSHVQVALQLLMERDDVRALASGTSGVKRRHSPSSPLMKSAEFPYGIADRAPAADGGGRLA